MSWGLAALPAVVAGAAAALALVPWAADRRRAPVSDEERAEAPGDFAGLADGVTHFRWYGSETGPVHVLVHSLTDDANAWEELCGFLVLGGARVLVYDLYGRGYSDRPGARQDRAFFLRQLGGLLADLRLGDDIVLIGTGMGGAIATAFAEAEPGRVGQLVLIAPSGLSRSPSPFLDRCARLRLLGDALMALRGGRHLGGGGPRGAQSRGYLRAVLSSARHMLAERQERDHAELRRLGIPVLAIWGREDRVVPIRAMGELARANPEAHHAELAGAGHDLARSHAREVAAAIRLFISGARRAQARPISPTGASASMS